ncbi:unnamed protein product [Darwinula stevensoni]|uniref:Uncharacterized protein n=1 Tax=Darwinula stevensoni TaxID=69355 RepID=A0A7R9A0N3_9CRUS|nr:unnamed protein product [Darwinula stevensoni]CAG0885915.1 unnamed protein product [Darwinula stevensoni]
MKSLVILWSFLTGVFGEGMQQCGETLTGDSGSIVSPDYPKEYPNNSLCTWTILPQPPTEYPIILTFEEFFLDESDDCLSEHVSISNFDWATFCGENAPSTLEISDPSITIIFVSDDIPSPTMDRRFNITYRIDNGCDVEWKRFQDSCYYSDYTERKEFQLSDAQEACQAMGADVTSVHTQEEDEFIASQVQTSFNYIGARTGRDFPGDPFDFEFLDGTLSDYHNFNDAGAILDSLSWVVLTVDQWKNFPCDEGRPFICEYDGIPPIDIVPIGSTFDTAISICSVKGGNLIKIQDQGKREEVMRIFLNKYEPFPTKFWIGLRRNAATGEWNWVEDGSQLTYDNWAPGFPTRLPNHDCAAMVPSTWATVGGWAFGWTCKKSHDGISFHTFNRVLEFDPEP